ncbi:Protein of uncharacterised function (DUF3732) [Cedecea lapagei]|uniref:Protein of uncharacterized function (DUF3732) n=1 Tax=Cedecea lapagei TaxID=158823 RepID=A0A447UW70_9ENTR|nr:DUF3732 domain-containing protein [Cedecea lapagei]VEB94947.1 Protein of uncharacterised function (DUF3732) [Cedecea lapagei]
MKCFIKHIGVCDKKGNSHSVKFNQGVNIITGKSSTGKSAILEIFDYCFGSTDDSLPEGVITENSDIYFTILRIVGTYLILGRKYDSNYAYIIESNIIYDSAGNLITNTSYFEKHTMLPLKDFKKELGRYFNVTLTSVDEEPLNYYQNRKKATPSVRSFMSFILQHQNLIANKHALFYRFDEKEKRDQAIEHLPIFLGFAKQEFFILKQEQYEIEAKLKKINIILPKKNEDNERKKSELNYLLGTYSTLSGNKLINITAEEIIKSPEIYLNEIRRRDILINAEKTSLYETLNELEKKRSDLYIQKRELERERVLIQSGILNIDDYSEKIERINTPEKIEVQISHCPFCNQQHQKIADHVNQFHKAVEWLNSELSSTPYTRESFDEYDRNLAVKIAKINVDLKSFDAEINNINSETKLLRIGNQSLIGLVNESKFRIILYIEKLIKNEKNLLQEEKGILEKKLVKINNRLKSFNVDHKMHEAENILCNFMNEFGKNLDFEPHYKPINLRFSFNSFDLWHEKNDEKRVYLRSMGSGANWLYCHLSLFVGLQRLFCELIDTCKIPPILFLDQPSQVYFPSIDDSKDTFHPEKLSFRKDKHLNHDMDAVKTFFKELINFCEETKVKTGYKPQIIISDHVDNIDFESNLIFEDYVVARWRKRGFIKVG